MKDKEFNFYERVYAVVEKIPKGKVATYGQIAMILGNPNASRAVGYALHNAPSQRSLPCHRVVNRKGELAPGAIFGKQEFQRDLLLAEGILFDINGLIDMERCIWHYGC